VLRLDPILITGATFSVLPSGGGQERFASVVIVNHSQYLLQITNGGSYWTIHPFMADVIAYDPDFPSVDITPMLMDLPIPGSASHCTLTFYAPGELEGTGQSYPTSMSVYVSLPLPNPQLWTMGADSIALPGPEALLTGLRQVTGWDGAVATGQTSYTVPAGKQLVVANIQLNARPAVIGLQVRLRSATTPAPPDQTKAMITLSAATNAFFGGATAGIGQGFTQTPFFGTRSIVLPAGATICVSAAAGGATAIDLWLVGQLESVAA
jgi:hypothetical protein